jgi:hypothetical protein
LTVERGGKKCRAVPLQASGMGLKCEILHDKGKEYGVIQYDQADEKKKFLQQWYAQGGGNTYDCKGKRRIPVDPDDLF